MCMPIRMNHNDGKRWFHVTKMLGKYIEEDETFHVYELGMLDADNGVDAVNELNAINKAYQDKAAKIVRDYKQ